MLIHNANVTGSMHLNGMDMSTLTGSVSSTTFNQYTSSTNEFTGSTNTRLNSLDSASGSFSTRVTSLESFSSSLDATFATDAQLTSLSSSVTQRLAGDESTITSNSSSFASRLTTDEGNLTTLSSSVASRLTTDESNISGLQTASGSFSTRVTTVESKYATTGSNTFTGTQNITNTTNASGFTSEAALYTDGGLRVSKDTYVSGTIFVNNLTVYGTQSVQYITSSQLEISDNIINVNTSSPGLRFGGIAVYDSGSTGLTGSFLWDSQNNKWIYSNPSGSSYDGGMAIFGPRNTSGLGSEQGTTSNALMKGQGGDHITSSLITDTGTALRVPYTVEVTGSVNATSLTGSLDGSNLVNSTVSNDKLANSSVTVTAGTGLSGGGSVALGSSITLTNTITNNNQLTNGAGYITGIDSNAVTTALGYTPVTNARTLTINGTSYDLSSNRSWTIAAGVSSVSAGTGVSVSGTENVTISNTGLLSATSGNGISVSTSLGNLNIVNTGLLSGTSGAGISVSTSLGNLNIVNTGLLSATSGNGISVSTSLGNVNIVNTGLLSATSGTGISVSTSLGNVNITNSGVTSNVAGTGISINSATGAVTISNTGVTSLTAGSGISISSATGGITVTNTITNNNQLTNGAGYITGITSGNVTTALGYTPYNPSSYPVNAGGETLASVTARGASTGTALSISNVLTVGSSGVLMDWWKDGSGTYMEFTGNSTSTRKLRLQGHNGSNDYTQLFVDGGNGYVYTNKSFRASIFYDLDNTAYYLDPASTSNLNGLTVGGSSVLTTGNYNSYSPTLTGGNASGTWGISISGKSETVTVNYNNDSNSTYQMLWGSGNSVYGTAGVYVNPYTDYVTATSFNASDWFRSSGTTGWYNGTYAVGIYATDSTWVRTYNDAQLYSSTIIQAGASVRAPIFYDANDTTYYVDPASTSVFNDIRINTGATQLVASNVGRNTKWRGLDGATDVGISFYNANNTWAAQLYANSGDGYGFLNGNWASWDMKKVVSGNLYLNNQLTYYINGDVSYFYRAYGTADMRSPIYYDLDNTGYYLDPASTSNLSALSVNSTMYAYNGIQMYRNGSASTGISWYNASYYNWQEYMASAGATGCGPNGNLTAPSGLTSVTSWALRSRMEGVGTYGWLWEVSSGGGGSATASSVMELDISGNLTVAASHRAPIFYDSNDTSRYIDPASTSQTNSMRASEFRGNANVGGTGEATWHPAGAYIGGTMWQYGAMYKNNTDIYDINIGYANSSFRAPIFYDSNDTGYYLDSNSTADNALRIRGGALHGPNPTWGKYILIGGDGRQNRINDTDVASVCTTNGNLHLDAASGYATYINHYDGGTIYFGGGANNNWGEFSGGIFYSYADTRSPIYYDYNDTSYYVNPNGTARLSYVVANAGIRIDGNENLYLDNNYGQSIVGVYASTRYQGVFAMGNSYKLPIDGTSTGSLYGLAWSHPNAGGVAGNLNTHGLLAMENGTWLASLTGSTRARDDMRAPIFYDNNDTGYYIDPAGTSNLNKLSAFTMAYNDMNPMSANSPYASRYAGSANYRNGTMGYGTTDFNVMFSNWGSGFIDSWSSPGNAPGGSSHYVGHQVAHYNHQNSANVYGYQMACAGEAVNRFFWRSSWATPNAWVEMIHSGNISGQTVTNSSQLGGYSGSNFLGKNGNSYYQADTWIQLNGGHGLYAPSYYSAHLYPNTSSTYTQWALNGSKNSYGGFYDVYSAVNGFMYDSAGNGGVYREANGLWYFYYHIGNSCMGIGTSTTSSSYKMYVNGAIYSTGNICAYSDVRKKENIETIDNALNKVNKMRGVYYNRTDDENKKKQTGVIAQEMEQVLPEVVNYAADVDEYSVAYGNIVGVLIEAIKEQQLQIDELKALLNK